MAYKELHFLRAGREQKRSGQLGKDNSRLKYYRSHLAVHTRFFLQFLLHSSSIHRRDICWHYRPAILFFLLLLLFHSWIVAKAFLLPGSILALVLRPSCPIIQKTY